MTDAAENQLELLRSAPEQIYEFRKIKEQDQFTVPEKYSNRKRTDVCFLVFLILVILGYFTLIAIAITKTRPDMLKYGYDNCGNVCGLENEVDENIPCSGRNLTDKPQMTVRYASNDSYEFIVEECAKDCEKGVMALGRCYLHHSNDFQSKGRAKRKSGLDEFCDEMKSNAIYLAIQVPVGLVITAVVYTILVLYARQVVKPFFYMGLVVQLAVAGFMIYLFCKQSSGPLSFSGVSYLFPAIGLIITVLFNICFCSLCKYEFELSIRLIEEAIEIFRNVPLTLFQPILTTIFQMLVIAGGTALCILLTTSHTFNPIDDDEFEFSATGMVIGCYVYTLFLGFWLLILANHCQFMILAGCFSPFYFTRDRSTVKRPISMSYAIVCTFHLGTVAFGSMIIALIRTVRVIARRLIENSMLRCFVDCLLSCCEDIIEYISEKAYIVTFLHGTSYCKSAKRSFKLLFINFLLTMGLDSVAFMIFTSLTVSLTSLTAGVGFIIKIFIESEYFQLIVYIGAVIVFAFAAALSTIFETAIKTIFICFCEDQMLNDGKSRPYYMPKSILTLIEDAKKFEDEKNKDKGCCC